MACPCAYAVVHPRLASNRVVTRQTPKSQSGSGGSDKLKPGLAPLGLTLSCTTCDKPISTSSSLPAAPAASGALVAVDAPPSRGPCGCGDLRDTRQLHVMRYDLTWLG